MSHVPPYPAPRPAQKNTLKIVLIVLAVVLVPCLALIGFVMWGAMRFASQVGKTMVPTITCAAGFEEVRDAMLLYAKANDGKLPSAKTWQTDVKPYYKKVRGENPLPQDFFEIKKMPVDGNWGCKLQNRETGMAFNAAVAGKEVSTLRDDTVLLFETDKPRPNAAEKYVPRPKSSGPYLIMNERRDWIVVRVSGDSNFTMGTSGRNTKRSTDLPD